MTGFDVDLSSLLHRAVPDPPIAIDYDTIRHRAHRRRGTIRLVPLTMLTTAAVPLTIHALAPSDHTSSPPAGPAGSSTISLPTRPTQPPTGGSIASPVIGVPYPFRLYTHCGIHYATFGGRTWSTARLVPEPTPRPDNNGITTYDGYTPGTMALVNPTTLVFTFDPNRVIVTAAAVTFHPTSDRPPLCA